MGSLGAYRRGTFALSICASSADSRAHHSALCAVLQPAQVSLGGGVQRGAFAMAICSVGHGYLPKLLTLDRSTSATSRTRFDTGQRHLLYTQLACFLLKALVWRSRFAASAVSS